MGEDFSVMQRLFYVRIVFGVRNCPQAAINRTFIFRYQTTNCGLRK